MTASRVEGEDDAHAGAAAAPLTFEVLTLFPEAIESFLAAGLVGQAIARELVKVHCTQIRAFASDKRGTVDDAPFGGGPGMVMRIEPVVAALESITAARGPMHRVLLTPSGARFDQAIARRLALLPRVGLVCGRYEGIDDRVREHFVDEALSLGDFVLNGGEVAALAIIEAVARLREGVLGNPDSIAAESFAEGEQGLVLEYPQYTRPAEFRGLTVPGVLLAGNHAAIATWRAAHARRRTWALRPDLRPRPVLPATTPIYLAVSGEPPADGQLGDALRTAQIAGLLVLGRDADAEPWIVATAGKVPVTAYADVRVLQKRLRRSHGHDPWFVGLPVPGFPTPLAGGGPGAGAMHAETGARILDERLAIDPDALVRPLVLVLGGGHRSGVEPAVTLPLAAIDGLASSPPMIDPSPPRLPGVGDLVVRAVALLRPRASDPSSP